MLEKKLFASSRVLSKRRLSSPVILRAALISERDGKRSKGAKQLLGSLLWAGVGE